MDEVTKDTQDAKQEPAIDEVVKARDEYLNNWKRAVADLANYKKGEVERAGLLVGYAKEGVLFNLLPILDSIYLLAKHARVEGVDLIEKQIAEFLKKEGIIEIEAIGKQFNAEVMEAVSEIEGGEAGMVAEELQKGYMIGGKVLRPARVRVAK